MKFNSPEEMQKYVSEECNDLYNPDTETYVFSYSENGAIATYPVSPTAAVKLEYELIQTNYEEKYWSTKLGIGGSILENGAEMDFFMEHYKESGWIDTKDVMNLLDKPDFPFTREQLDADLSIKKDIEKDKPARAEKHMNRGGIER